MAPVEVLSPRPSIGFVVHTALSTDIAIVPTHRSRSTIHPSVSATTLSLHSRILLPTVNFPVATHPPSDDDPPDAPTSLETLALIIAGIVVLICVTGCYRLRQMTRPVRTDRSLDRCREHDMIHTTTTTTVASPLCRHQPAAVVSLREESLSLSSEALDHGPVSVTEMPPPPYDYPSRP